MQFENCVDPDEVAENIFSDRINLHVWQGTFLNLAPSYKTFFMLNSVEHKILNAHKYEKNQ